MTMTNDQKVEFQIQNYMAKKLERDQAQAAMDFAKAEIIEHFNTVEDSTIRVGYDGNHDIKATFNPRTSTKLDVEKLAEDMNVEKKVVKRDFLIKSVDDGKLNFEQFKSYYFSETNDAVSIRLVKLEDKKK